MSLTPHRSLSCLEAPVAAHLLAFVKHVTKGEREQATEEFNHLRDRAPELAAGIQKAIRTGDLPLVIGIPLPDDERQFYTY